MQSELYLINIGENVKISARTGNASLFALKVYNHQGRCRIYAP